METNRSERIVCKDIASCKKKQKQIKGLQKGEEDDKKSEYLTFLQFCHKHNLSQIRYFLLWTSRHQRHKQEVGHRFLQLCPIRMKRTSLYSSCVRCIKAMLPELNCRSQLHYFLKKSVKCAVSIHRLMWAGLCHREHIRITGTALY